MKRQYLLSLPKYQGNYIKKEIENATEDIINNIYENEKLTEKALDNGINCYRISWYNDLETTKKELKKYIKENNIKEFKDGYIKNGGYFGNYCLPYIIEKDALKIKEVFKDKVKLDLHRHYIGKVEFILFNIGDKVILNKTNSFGINSNNKGTVYKKDENSITIRKYRSKTKGYIIRIGDEATISKINKF